MNKIEILTKQQQIFDLEFKYNNFGYNSYEEIDWTKISIYEELSEDFIREFKDKVYWDCISVNRNLKNLSEEFIREFKDKLNILFNNFE